MSIAFVFPGQGSQSVGMLSELADVYPVVGQTFEEASEAIGFDLGKLVASGPESDLNQTQNTQPAMLAAGVAVWRVWQEEGGATPAIMAGHSLGEYTALTCAGVFEFRDAVLLVADRGRFMQEAVPEGKGAMAAILGMEDEQVRSLCENNANGQVLAPVNFNSPGQVVIAGEAAAVQRAVDNAEAAGAKKAVVLPVSVPSHCSLMHNAAENMRARLLEVDMKAPSLPVLHNVSVKAEESVDGIREALVKQIESPVRWVETVQTIASQGATLLIECGPGKVLFGLNKRITREAKTLPVYDPATLDSALVQVSGS